MTDALLAPIWRTEPKKWSYATASHLLNRAGFGGSAAEVRQLVDLGPEKAVAYLVRYQQLPDTFKEITFGEFTGPLFAGRDEMRQMRPGQMSDNMRELKARGELLKQMNQDQRQAMLSIRLAAQRGKLEEMKLWWLDRMVRTRRPLEEKMTLFWHGLFVSSSVTVRNSYALYQQNKLFRKFAVGNYKALTLEVSKDPAMLEYLNNNQNKKGKPNENYARELMELFTMGIGNYTENDIKESARAFTGWTFAGDRFVFNRGEHDEGQKTFLGRTGNWDGGDIIDIIFDQQATPRYIARRLLKFFALDGASGAEAPESMVNALARVVVANRYEMAPVLETLFASTWFYSKDVMRTQIKSPVQLVVGSLRALGVNITDPRAVDNALKMMGQELYGAPTVKGWDGGRAWVNTSTLFARYNLPAYLGTGRLPSTSKKPGDGEMRGQFNDLATGWQPQLDLAEARASTTDGVVDHYLRVLIGNNVDPRKRDELIEFLNATGDASSHHLDPTSAEVENRIRSLVHLIMAMAEYQIC